MDFLKMYILLCLALISQAQAIQRRYLEMKSASHPKSIDFVQNKVFPEVLTEIGVLNIENEYNHDKTAVIGIASLGTFYDNTHNMNEAKKRFLNFKGLANKAISSVKNVGKDVINTGKNVVKNVGTAVVNTGKNVGAVAVNSGKIVGAVAVNTGKTVGAVVVNTGETVGKVVANTGEIVGKNVAEFVTDEKTIKALEIIGVGAACGGMGAVGGLVSPAVGVAGAIAAGAGCAVLTSLIA